MESIKSIPVILQELINEKNIDQHEKEMYLSRHYNEILDHPNLLQKIYIAQHYRILSHALTNGYANIDHLILYIVNQLELGNIETNVLLSLFNPFKMTTSQINKVLECQNVMNNCFDFHLAQINLLNDENQKLEKQLEDMRKQNQELETKIKEKERIEKLKTELNHTFDLSIIDSLIGNHGNVTSQTLNSVFGTGNLNLAKMLINYGNISVNGRDKEIFIF